MAEILIKAASFVAIIFMGVVVCMVLMAVFPALYGSFENIQ